MGGDLIFAVTAIAPEAAGAAILVGVMTCTELIRTLRATTID